ncbi:sterile alpha motif domain-containing protein 3 [Ctenodactylus gundi]
METWSVDQVCGWLLEKNLGELVPRFQEEEVSGAALLALNDRMVQQLVKKIGHQAVLMDLITKYKKNSQGQSSPGSPTELAAVTHTEAVPEEKHPSCPTSRAEETLSFHPAESLHNGLIDHRVLKQRRNTRHVLARTKALRWTRSYVLPEFPYDVRCTLAEHRCPDHSMRIRIIEFLQADMTKYLEGSLYPTTQQYNDVVNALLQAHPFLDEDGCGFLLWKRALKDRFKYVRRPIEDDEQVMRNKCKFGHRRGQTRKSLANTKSDDIKIVQIKEESVRLGSEVDEHIHRPQQAYMRPEKNWREIDQRMSQTLEIRRKMIHSRTSLKDIPKMFPFLKCPYQSGVTTGQEIQETCSDKRPWLPSAPRIESPLLVQGRQEILTSGMFALTDIKMTATCLILPGVLGDDPSLFLVFNEKVQVSTPVLEVKNPFNVDVCEFSLYLDREKLTQVDDCITAVAALVAAFRVFGIEHPKRLFQTLNFLETLILI